MPDLFFGSEKTVHLYRRFRSQDGAKGILQKNAEVGILVCGCKGKGAAWLKKAMPVSQRS